MRVNMHEAKTNLSKLVAAIERGETDEIEIARAGHVVARIVGPRPVASRTPGMWAGRVRVHADFDELPEDVAAAFRGESAGSCCSIPTSCCGGSPTTRSCPRPPARAA